MSHSIRTSPRPRIRLASLALVGIAATAFASGCGSSSSGGGPKADTATTFAAALQLQKEGKLGQAAQLYQQVIKSDPTNLFAQYDLGVVLQANSNPKGALAAYGAALAINPKYVPALFNEATIYGATDPVLAISLYRQIVVLQSNAPTAYLNLGFLEIKRHQPKLGVHDLARAVQQDPTLLPRVPHNLQALVTALARPKSTSPSPHKTPTSSVTPTTSPS